jgi:UDP-N-acetylmuramate--alanine ligase
MEPKLQKRYHLVGVAGVGMSALAQVLLAQGHLVTGSDRYNDEKRQPPNVLRKLRVAGVQLMPQDGSAVTSDTDAIVVSTAIEDDNADLLAARAGNIPVLHRADMLASLAAGHTLVGVTGTSGKTTVTGMIGWILECLGQDPTVVNGGAVINWRREDRIGNVRVGRSNLWVLELDESDRSLLRFAPDWAVVNNISKDHFELMEVQSLFREFAGRVRVGIVCGQGVSTVLLDGSPSWKRNKAVVEEPMDYFEEFGRGGFRHKGIAFHSPLIGRHNADNAHAAVVLCDLLGLDLAAVRNALSSFAGIERRLEKVGEANNVAIIDDYAHNPAKIRASWRAVAAQHGRVLGIWRPHGFGPLASMMNELIETFAGICRPDDQIYILRVYYAGGTAQRKAKSDDLVRALNDRGLRAQSIHGYEDLFTCLQKKIRSGDAVLCMGARDPELPLFARRLADTLKSA